MKLKIKRLLLWGFAVLPLLMVAAVWGRLPSQVPIHWNVQGAVDNYAGRQTLWLLAGFSLLFTLLMTIAPKIDPKRANYERFRDTYLSFQLIIVLLCNGLTAITLTESLRPGTVGVGTASQLMIGLVLVLLGNIMPRCRHNWFCGIKTPWTLASERVWTKTHRLGGYSYFIAGLLAMTGAFLPAPAGFVLVIGSTVTAALLPVLMSFLWYRQEMAG